MEAHLPEMLIQLTYMHYRGNIKLHYLQKHHAVKGLLLADGYVSSLYYSQDLPMEMLVLQAMYKLQILLILVLAVEPKVIIGRL